MIPFPHVMHRFLFTDYNRLSSVGGETSMAEMIATLSDACEREFGFMAARLFRVFKNDEVQGKKLLTLALRCQRCHDLCEDFIRCWPTNEKRFIHFQS